MKPGSIEVNLGSQDATDELVGKLICKCFKLK